MVLKEVVLEGEQQQPELRRRNSHVPSTGRRVSQPTHIEGWQSEGGPLKGHGDDVVHLNQHGQPCVPLSMFPEKIASKLKIFDEDNNGTVSEGKLEHAIESLAREKSHSQTLFRGVLVLVIFSLLMLLSITGMTFYIVEVSKEMRLGENSVLMTTTGSDPVKVASADFQIQDNTLVPRNCEGTGTCSPLGVSLSRYNTPLSSDLSDDVFKGLSSMTIRGDSGLLHLTVSAFARFPDEASKDRSVVVLYTHLGEVSLEGEEISFEPTASDAFTRAGFVVDSSRRRLLAKDGAQISGLVQGNAVGKILDRGEAGDNVGLLLREYSDGQKSKQLGKVFRRILSAISGPHVYAESAELELEELGGEVFETAEEIVRLKKRPDLLTQEWNDLIDEEVTVLSENPLATRRAGEYNVEDFRVEQRTDYEQLSMQVDTVYRVSALGRKVRRHAARARRKAARRSRRSGDFIPAGTRLLLAADEVQAECKPGLSEDELVELEKKSEQLVPLEAVKKLADGKKKAEAVGDEYAADVISQLVRLLEGRRDIMQEDQVIILERELDQCSPGKVPCYLDDAEKLGWSGDALGPLLALYQRIFDAMDNTAYWTELARVVADYKSSGATTVKGSKIDLNPRLAMGNGLASSFEVKYKAWRQKGDGGCGKGGTCPCDLTAEKGICLFGGRRSGERQLLEGDEKEQECKCEWEEVDWVKEDPDWVTVLMSSEVTSKREGQPLRTLAQDIRVEVQTIKNSSKRRGIGLEQDGIATVTFESSTTYKKGDSVSLVGFGTFSTSNRAARSGRRRRRGPELDHLGSYNFMVEVSGVSSKRLNWQTAGGECEDTYEPVDVFEYTEEEALKLADQIVQPQNSVGGWLDKTGCLLYPGLEPQFAREKGDLRENAEYEDAKKLAGASEVKQAAEQEVSKSP
mmetsp:Transcript_37375/g.76695  ORF Transcript_37375/g.76695 Transcript_37375/m.76695 type:complete len:915 (+) Transcript_37375:13-2757(+)|eukprot:CAMPEP_0181328132 /NCGR_PEP_ID=MMETSP1101-20121128/22522_1 /TAXON_ID=46948 /ORGANISM="Rhodomonas abbreviata, Strain Caron Lab Isolate" /LENGTH=914 /DNA_ID=CAMNT_0023436939 /DNA_START=13 /DNA_END=2757 /DNA_ORIENTATION=+